MLKQSELADLIALTSQPHLQADIKKDRAAILTLGDVQAEAARWMMVADPTYCEDYVGMIALSPKGPRLYKALREAVRTDALREVVDSAWTRLHPKDPSNCGETIRYIHDDESELVAVISEKCVLVWRRSRLWFALKQPDGSWLLVSRRDAELALAPYMLCVDIERVVRDGKSRPQTIKAKKTISGFSVLLKSANRKVYYGANHYGSNALTPPLHLNLNGDSQVEQPADIRWLANCLSRGCFETKDGKSVVWEPEGGPVRKTSILQSYRDHVPSKPPHSSEGLAQFLKRAMGLPRSRRIAIRPGRKREAYYQMPDLESARRQFRRRNE